MDHTIPSHRLLMEQQKLLYKNSRGPILFSLLLAIFLCWYLRHSADTAVLLSWLTVFFLISFGRLLMVSLAIQSMRRRTNKTKVDIVFLSGVWLAAATWGVSSFLMYPAGHQENQTVFLIIIVGISAGAITSLCPNWSAVCGFLSLTLLPLALRLITVEESNGVVLGLLTALFWFVCLIGAKQLHTNIIDNISLRLKSAEHETDLKIGKERYLHIFNHSFLGIVHYDSSGSIIDYNEVFAKVIGLSMPPKAGSNILTDLKNEEFKKAVRRSLQKGEGYFKGEYINPETGRKRPVRIYLKATRSTDNTIIGGIGTLEDFSEKQLFEQKIEQQASYDSLTGLPNRNLLLKLLDQELSRATRHKQKGALLFMDLDNFKTINDSLGHNAGDTLLKDVAQRIIANHRKEDVTSRMGGDEFVILLPNLDKNIETAAQKSQEIAKKLATIMAAPFSIENQEISITSSMGISLFPERGKDANDVLKEADTAMNQAKTEGRNTVQFFRPSMQQAADKRLRLNNDIKKAIENKELSLHFQPQVKIDGTIVGGEALLRWTHPERGMIPPGELIPVAEETGIIVEIGNWVLRKACETIREWEGNSLLNEDQTIAVNISPREFSTPGFVKQVIKTIEETGIDPQHLEIELTEGSLISSVDDTITKIQSLRDYGVKFSVDDFGTGYSSLSYLKSLPLHTLKIDRSFVNDIQPDNKEPLLVEIIIAMANKLGMEIVAEGVETEEQLNYLASKGCNVYQGYYFCKPIPTPEFMKLLESGIVTV